MGWVYEFAEQNSQRYKEGHFLLEAGMITESDGIEEISWKLSQFNWKSKELYYFLYIVLIQYILSSQVCLKCRHLLYLH